MQANLRPLKSSGPLSRGRFGWRVVAQMCTVALLTLIVLRMALLGDSQQDGGSVRRESRPVQSAVFPALTPFVEDIPVTNAQDYSPPSVVPREVVKAAGGAGKMATDPLVTACRERLDYPDDGCGLESPLYFPTFAPSLDLDLVPPPFPPAAPYWPRPFAITPDNVLTRSGRMLHEMLGGRRRDGVLIDGENDYGDAIDASITANKSFPLGSARMPMVEGKEARRGATRWVFPPDHTASWSSKWREVIWAHSGTWISSSSSGMAKEGNLQLDPLQVSNGVKRLLSDKPMQLGIETMANAFLAYNKDPQGKATVPAYSTILGGADRVLFPRHMQSLRTAGRFLLILNTVDEEWVSLCRLLERAFPQRFVVEYAMVRTQQLKREQIEYRARHKGESGIMANPADFISAADMKAKFAAEDDEDDRLDVLALAKARSAHSNPLAPPTEHINAMPRTTAFYRWHLRNMHPDLLQVALSNFHGVSMGWNRILHLCFRGEHPIDYVFIANGDFVLGGNDLPMFAEYVHQVNEDEVGGTQKGRKTLGGYYGGLSFAFYVYTYNAWQRFGEFDESMFPLYKEDHEFHSRILVGGMDMFAPFDDFYKGKKHNYYHGHSLSRKDPSIRSELDNLVPRTDQKGYIKRKYAATRPKLNDIPSYKFPFNNSNVAVRNCWAVDYEYRRRLLAGESPQMDIAKMGRLLQGLDQTP